MNKTMKSPVIPGLSIGAAFVIWLVCTTGLCLCFSWPKVPNSLGLMVLFFNNLNMLIALCEICLGKHIMFIKKEYQRLKQEYKGREWEACIAYLTMPLSLETLFDGREWGKMWSTYSLYDPSYQNHESFGFFIDVGNGWSTIPPGILWNLAICDSKLVSPLFVGCIGMCHYWQVMYGAIIYFLSFAFNKRYKGRNLVEVLAFVGVSNSIWIIFPSFALYCSYCILRDNDFSVFERTATSY